MVEVVTGVADYRASEAWDGKPIATIGNARTMVLWADRPFHWHENSTDELFVVLNGRVDMQYRDATGEHRVWMETGDMMVIRQGESHVAHPEGEVRLLIVAHPADKED
ncbi:cupin domain-containing protein [Sphingomicrobium nitratireducens]|uniref:cupin domain-containing protein n=1 Tax=Sphingomicrobium nitratireducens TaxID=2964666 RepID=UPI00223F3F6F|nr:cupin domain-containing protein [Sphingomicrobium nitratireducens]